MENSVAGLRIWDINWGNNNVPPVEEDIQYFKNFEEMKRFVDRDCDTFDKYTVDDEAVDNYFFEKYGMIAEEFRAEFFWEGESNG